MWALTAGSTVQYMKCSALVNICVVMQLCSTVHCAAVCSTIHEGPHLPVLSPAKMQCMSARVCSACACFAWLQEPPAGATKPGEAEEGGDDDEEGGGGVKDEEDEVKPVVKVGAGCDI